MLSFSFNLKKNISLMIGLGVLYMGTNVSTNADVNQYNGEQSIYSSTSSDNNARNIMNGNVPSFNNSDLNWGNGSYNNNYINNGYNNFYNEITTGSRGVLVVDLQDNSTIYEKNADISRPIASITKLMTAMVVLDAKQEMSELMFLQDVDTQKRSGFEKSTNYKSVYQGDELNRAQWLLIMLMKSENRAAKLLARNYPGGYYAFIEAMNKKAQDLGMYSSEFYDPSGLDKRNVASPRDLAKMVKAAGGYEIIRQFSTTKNYDFYLKNRVIAARNTSYLVRDGKYNIGVSKTGYIRESGKCYVMETMVNGRPSIVVILGARSSKVRWRDAENILGFLSRKYKQT